MNFELKPSDPRPVVEEKIFIDGDEVGEIRICHEYREGHRLRYHVMFRTRGLIGHLLVQGHGGTKEEAILDAIECGRREGKVLLDFTEDLAIKLRVVGR